ncbi:MAG: Leucine efflux protein [Pseudomonadota bacterium]|jgi:leucine efflux protein
MFGISDYAQYCVTIVLFLAVPGPGNLALITSTTQGGIRGGLAAIAGIAFGDQILMWAAIAGVAAVLAAYPAAFRVVQWGGAVYLAWLGWQMLRAKPGDGPVLNFRPSHFFQQSLAITLLNPKAIVFYMAFFPLFIDPARSLGLPTYLALTLTSSLLMVLYGLGSVGLTYFLAHRFRADPRLGLWLQRLAGACLVGFGIKLAVSK